MNVVQVGVFLGLMALLAAMICALPMLAVLIAALSGGTETVRHLLATVPSTVRPSVRKPLSVQQSANRRRSATDRYTSLQIAFTAIDG